MSTPLTLQPFGCKDRELYREYLGIKLDVFVKEQGWSGLADSLDPTVARADEFDVMGQFLIARIVGGPAVGCIRGVELAAGFPHANLFEHHFRNPDVLSMRHHLFTINSLAVLRPFRRLQCEDIERGWFGGIGTLLTLTLCREMEERGLRGGIATAEGKASASFFRRCGFCMIDPPIVTALHPQFAMTNIGVVFGSCAHERRERECRVGTMRSVIQPKETSRLLDYFEQRQAEILGSSELAV